MRLRLGRAWLVCLVVGFMTATVSPAHASSVLKRNLVDLIDLASEVVVGDVLSVTDGFQNGVPYTEITLQVKDSYKNDVGETFTFRQFGLTQPREVGGKMYVGVSPDGWPTFASGERVLLFLCQPGAETGFCTTIGLFQGKFTLNGGEIENSINNRGLFDDVEFDAGLLSPGQTKCSQMAAGAMPAADILSIVKSAIQDGWIDQGGMRHAN